MKRALSILFTLLTFTVVVYAQGETSNFLFESYKDAILFYKNGLQSNEKVNFNMIDEKLYFIDRSDKQIKIASGTDNITSILIDDKSYVIDENGLKEILATNPVLLYVRYKVQSRSKPTQVAYGGTSNISSVSTYSDYRSGGQQTILKSQDMEVSNIYNCYWIEKNNKKYKFENKDHFFRIYAKKKDLIGQYLQDNKVNFTNKNDIIKLVLFAEGLN